MEGVYEGVRVEGEGEGEGEDDDAYKGEGEGERMRVRWLARLVLATPGCATMAFTLWVYGEGCLCV